MSNDVMTMIVFHTKIVSNVLMISHFQHYAVKYIIDNIFVIAFWIAPNFLDIIFKNKTSMDKKMVTYQ